jgi:hypothetical protein
MQQGRRRASGEWTRDRSGAGGEMKELLRTNDMVLVSFVRSLLDDAQIPHVILDNHMSVIEGSLGILPRRVLVGEDFIPAARRILSENGLRDQLRPSDA